MRILVVEDDAKLSSFLVQGLTEAGFVVDAVRDGEEGLYFALKESYDAAIIDIMLPQRDGLSLIEEMRKQKKNTPLIILSAKRSVDDRIKGLQIGGDDYLTKPFAFSELLARLQALIRRAKGSSEPSCLIAGELTVDLLKREVTRGTKKLDLQPKEFALLEYLMRHVNQPVSKAMILEHVWNYHFDPQTDVVDVLVCRLRSKIDKGFEKKMIHTIRGIGYVFRVS
jgi:two-component system OmpR family response regulator